MKIAFCKMCFTVCRRFVPNKRNSAGCVT
ncbi:DUF6783 domain-containing protein [uncultured Robinsoniella sp.]